MVLDDPRLEEAKNLVLAKKPLEAAKAVDRANVASIEAAISARWHYRAALLEKTNGDPKGAELAFEKVATFDGPLKPYALLEAAEIRLAADDDDAAANDLRAVDREAVPRGRYALSMARALVRTGKLDDGFAFYQELTDKRGSSWGKNTLEYARTLLSHPASGRPLKAAHLALDVELDGPANLESDAKKIRDEAENVCSSGDRKELDSPPAKELVARANRLITSGRAKKALTIAERLSKSGDEVCAVTALHAEALLAVDREAEGKAEFGRARTACGADGIPSRVVAYFDKRGIVSADRGSKNAGPSSQDALFLVALEQMKAGEWQSALDTLSTCDKHDKERSYQRAGRFSYFSGRALLALGRSDEARKELAKTIRDFPLSYYSALAYATLESISSGMGKTVLEASLKTDAPPAIGSPSDAVIESAAFRAAVELAGEDDADGVLSALDALGVLDRSADPEVTLAGALLLGRTSSPKAAHLLLRSASEYEPSIGRKEVYAYRDAYPIGSNRRVWELAYPRAFEADVEKAARESDIPEALLYAITREESAFEPSAISKAGAIGLTQVMPATARNGAKRLGLPFDEAAVREPGENLRLGAHFLKKMRDDFPDDPLLAIPAYNAGPGAPDKWTKAHPDVAFDLFVEDIPYAETRSYTKRVISSLLAYEVLYGSIDASEALRTPKLARKGL
jgi:soluble lytic murein transglycosylase